MDMNFLFGAIAIMVIVIASDFIKRKYKFDMDNFEFDMDKLKSGVATEVALTTNTKYAVKRTTGKRKVILLNAGDNKATVMATLRQITGIDYQTAKLAVDTVPAVVIMNVSDREAILNKRALEFVGAKCEVR